jgi:signal transduction histidine kinase
MKNRITWKLTLYFSVVLLLFSAIIGSVFMVLFKSHTMQLQKTELQKRAETMAGTISGFASSSGSGNGMMGSGKMGYGAYLRFLNDIAMTDVWIVDENLDLITGGPMTQYQYSDLPQDADKVVKEVFLNRTTFSEGFSGLLNKPTLTVGTPIVSNGKVVGALLLHSPVEGINEANSQGFLILVISMTAAFLLTLVLSGILAANFTRPLKKMKDSAMLLAAGNYTAKTEVRQRDEIGELAAAIDILSERLDLADQEREKLNQLRRDFVANISHELRTPVTVIRGSLEALCDEVVTDPEQVRSYHHQMLNESMFLQRLVNDLLDLSRLQNTDFKMEIQEISLCDVLSDAIRSAQHMAQKKNVEIQQKQEAPMCSVIGDYGRLRQMFLIILDNAVKFSPQGSTVTVTMKGNTVSIQDCGIGISPEDLPYIFDRFYKVNSEKNKSGTGLGLAIAKQIADRHNIQISICSQVNQGTEFRFQF